MYKKKLFLSIVFISLSFVLLPNVYCEKEKWPLELIIEPNSKFYEISEKVEIKVLIKNNSNEKQKIDVCPYMVHFDYEMELLDSNNNPVEKTQYGKEKKNFRNTKYKEYYVQLESERIPPGIKIRLSGFYLNDQYRLSKAGLYTLRFSKLIAFGYNNVISSNPIEIEIVNKKEKHIDFKINSDKAVYHLNDSINIKGEIKNISDKVLVVDSTYGMNLEITDSKGGKIDAIKNEAEVLLAIQSKILRPNESLYLNSGLHHHFILDKLGRYFIKARYSTSYSILEEEKKSTCYWAGVLESNIINIQLVE